MAAFLVLFSVEKAAISIEIRSKLVVYPYYAHHYCYIIISLHHYIIGPLLVSPRMRPLGLLLLLQAQGLMNWIKQQEVCLNSTMHA